MKKPWILSFAGWVLLVLVATWTHATAQQPPGGSSKKVRINPVIAALEEGKLAEARVVMPRGGSMLPADLESPGTWTFVDMEHGSVPTLTEVQSLINQLLVKKKPNGQLMSAPLVRVPMYGYEDPGFLVKQILDSGAFGIIFPQVETKAQAMRAIQSMRFPNQKGAKYPFPVGFRGSGGASRQWGVSRYEYWDKADVWPLNPDGELFAVIMIEGPEGAKNINEILDVPGIGAIFIGPTDLGMNLGVGAPKTVQERPVDHVAQEEMAAIKNVASACKVKKVVCGISVMGMGGASPKERQDLLNMGFRFLQ